MTQSKRSGRASVGMFLMLMSAVLLMWNEHRTVERVQALQEGSQITISVDANEVNSNHEQQLVHLSANVVTDEILKDKSFGIEVNALKLRRKVEVYQWQEKLKEGATEANLSTVTYEKVWSDQLIESADFVQAQYQNPTTFQYEREDQQAQTITIGAFELSTDLIAHLQQFRPLKISQQVVKQQQFPPHTQLYGNGFYIGQNPALPEIGDTKITYQVIEPLLMTVVAQQLGSSLQIFHTKSGSRLALLSKDTLTKDQIFTQAFEQNTVLTWGLRILGIGLMIVGFRMMLFPLSRLLGYIPVIGVVAEKSLGWVATLLAVLLSLVLIGLAWLLVRPLFAIGLVTFVVASLLVLNVRNRQSA